MDTKKNLIRTGAGPSLLLAAMADYDPNSMPVEQARAFIQKFLVPIDATDTVNLHDALGRTVASDVLSPMHVPPHDYSAMDGYALRHADVATGTTTFRIAGKSFAGHPFTGELATGECVRIMTGALIPTGCDTVVMQEHVKLEEQTITIDDTLKAGQNIRRMGEDLRQGETALAQGKRIGAAEIGLLASLGLSRATVFKKLRVAVFSTGDELLQPGALHKPGKIYDSNRYSLYGMLHELGGMEILDMGNIRDDREAIRAALLSSAARADVIITSGGVSVGDADYIKELLGEIGEVVFWKIAMKPGRPLAYGKIGSCHFFGLPGNPVAVMVSFRQFVADALRHLMGQAPQPGFTLKAVCTEKISKKPGRTDFQRGILEQDANGAFTVRTTGGQGSGILSSMSRANCFIVLPMEQGNVEPGATVDVQLFHGLT